jgi:hypothetical protein
LLFCALRGRCGAPRELLLYPENRQQYWWFQKALALPSLFIRAKRETLPFVDNKIEAIKMAIDIYYFNSGRAIIASGGFFDEPIGSACGMPQEVTYGSFSIYRRFRFSRAVNI